MISPEILRRYPFFSFMNHDQLREVAMIAEQVSVTEGEVLFNIGQVADALYLLMTGSVHLHYIVTDNHDPELRKDFLVGNINPGEALGISAVIEPYQLTATAVANEGGQLLKIDATALRTLCENDAALAYGLQRQIAKATMERLHDTRIQLAAATTPVEV
jgi:CRP/FNR family cyclic AMP-dependent transcriptional regulator